MKNLSLPVIILIVLIIGVIGEVLLYFNVHEFDSLQRIISAFGRLAAIIFLVKEGSFIKSKILITIQGIFIFIFLVGMLFKILHWEGADLLLMIGLIGIPVVYLIHFLRKKNKGITDYLKAVWLGVFSTGLLFTILHWPYANLLIQIQAILFLTLFVMYVVILTKNGSKRSMKTNNFVL